MKILEVSRSFYPSVGGLEKFVEDRIKLYKYLGYEHKLIATDFRTEKSDYSESFSNVTFVKQYTPYNLCPSINKHLSNDFDIISVNQMGRFFSDFTVRWANKRRIPVILTPHYHYHTPRYKFIKYLVSKFLIKKSLDICSAVICFTNCEKLFWTSFHRSIEDKIHVIPHYYKLLKFNKSDISDQNYLLYVGRYDNNKRIDLLLQAFNLISNKELQLFLTINPNDLPNNLKQFASNDRIKFLGYVSEDEKIRLLKGCSAVVLPSDFEAFGITLLEASNFKKPLLVSCLPVFFEIHDSRGMLTFYNCVKELKEAIEALSRLPIEAKEKMGEYNYQNLTRYDFLKIADIYKSLFDKIMIASF